MCEVRSEKTSRILRTATVELPPDAHERVSIPGKTEDAFSSGESGPGAAGVRVSHTFHPTGEAFSPTGYTLFGLGERRRLGRAYRRQDVTQSMEFTVLCLQYVKDEGQGYWLILESDWWFQHRPLLTEAPESCHLCSLCLNDAFSSPSVVCVLPVSRQLCDRNVMNTCTCSVWMLYSPMDFALWSRQSKVPLMSAPTDSDICVLQYGSSRITSG